MSAEAENPYCVDSHFQSDGLRDTFRKLVAGKTTSKVAPEQEEYVGSYNTVRQEEDKRRADNLEKFYELTRANKYWSYDFKDAALCLCECLFVKLGRLYQGNSIFHDIYRDERRKPISNVKNVMCNVHEVGFPTEVTKMWVPKKGNNVLWRRVAFV